MGRDVESIVRDLTETGVALVLEEQKRAVQAKAEDRAEERLLDALLAAARPTFRAAGARGPERRRRASETREKLRRCCAAAPLDDREVELELRERRRGAHDLDLHAPGRRGDGHAVQGSARRAAAEADPPPAHEGPGGARGPGGRGSRPAGRHGRRTRAGDRAGGADGHRLHRRDRQGGDGRRRARGPRRLARGRTARSAADRRGLDRADEARARADGSRPVHRRGRLPRGQALGPDPGAAGALPDPRRALEPLPGGLRPDPHGAAQLPGAAVHGAARAPRASSSSSRRTASARSPTSPPASTSGPTTSARVGSTR